jgi:hypothetical protein
MDNVHKALVPLSKLNGLIDEDDIPAVTDFRCDKCANCHNCKLSSRAKSQSLQESFEQDGIVKSVKLDLIEKTDEGELPVVKQPVDFKHQLGTDNKHQSVQICPTLCCKPSEVKEKIRVTHIELLNKGFMVPISSTTADKQALPHSAPFCRYISVSVSSPQNLAVDSTCNGLKSLLTECHAMLVSVLPRIAQVFDPGGWLKLVKHQVKSVLRLAVCCHVSWRFSFPWRHQAPVFSCYLCMDKPKFAKTSFSGNASDVTSNSLHHNQEGLCTGVLSD